MDEDRPPDGIDDVAFGCVVAEAAMALEDAAPDGDQNSGSGGLAVAAAGLDVASDGIAAAPGDLATAPGGLVDGLPQPAVENAQDALALARELLPTAPLPTNEHDLPVVQVESSQINNMHNMERVDWSTIQIVETHDDEGRIEMMSESQICEILGLTDEGLPNVPMHGSDRRMDERGNDNVVVQEVDGAAIPTNDIVPGEVVISYDKNNPSMEMPSAAPPKKMTPKRNRHIG
ncbi:hypothetical protein SORBI_3008G069901 [Sorghum bicolor]|uniref:Uncharacterized protein n=1 Tax=Sorghum bicolor TaxID=4558 RepID=A0A1Z5R6A9_SORBI|nr:hypothetical protein SORBI_3008G069901 [Sorghum bicolor]